eukprot:8721537-Pyramimonas_sp.AAC.1
MTGKGGTRSSGPGVQWDCMQCGRYVKGHHWRCLCGQTYGQNQQQHNWAHHGSVLPGGAHYGGMGSGRVQARE